MNRLTDFPWTPLYTQLSASSFVTKTVTKIADKIVDKVTSPSMYTEYAMAATIAFTVLVYAWEKHLDARQRAAYMKTTFPKQLEVTVSAIDQERERQRQVEGRSEGETSKATETDTPANDDSEEKEKKDSFKPLLPQLKDKFKSSQAYGLDKINFGMFASTYDTLESIAFLLLGFLPYVWDTSVNLGKKYFNYTETENEIKITLIFLAIITLIGTVTSLPFELYSTFCIERKHGFNKQTIGLFVSDKIKSLFLSFAIGGPFVSLLLYIIHKGGDYFYIYVWAFMFVFSVIMMTIVPVFIMPLFNKYEPLQEGDLKRRIYELADRLKYPLTKLFVMDGSKRSSHSNAFMFGFGKHKRIVLFDTLLTQVTDDEILAILGHELGHWKMGHTVANFIVTQLYFGAAFYAFSLAYGSNDLYAAFGFNDPTRPKPNIIALLLFFQTLWAPVDKVLNFILTVNTRRNEFQADKFSVDLGFSKKLQSGLCKLHLENLGAMCPDPWYSTYHYSHPPLVERLSAMMALDKKQE